MFFPKLSQVATLDVVTIDDQNSIQQAIHLMHEQHIRDVIVTGSKGLRILTAKELIEFRVLEISFDSKLADVELNSVPTLPPDASVIEGLNVIKSHPDEHLCLIDENHKLIGIVSYTDLASCLDPQHLAQTKSLGEIVRLTRVQRFQPSDAIKDVFLQLNKLKQTAAIIVEDNHPIGIITQSDIIDLLDHQHDWYRPVGEAMTSPILTLDESMSLQEALTFSRRKKIKRLVVVDRQNRISGILHQKDLVALVYQDWSDLLQQQKMQLKMERDLFAGGPVAVIIWRVESGWPVEFISQNIKPILGYEADWFLNGNVHYRNLIHQDDLQRIDHEVAKFIAEQRQSWEQHYRLMDINGQCHWIYDYTRAEYNKNGEVSKLYGYLLDQTEQEHTKQQLQIAKERFASVADQAGQVIWEINPEGLYTYISQAVEQALGYSPQELIGKVHYFDLHPEEGREAFKQDTFAMIKQRVALTDFENIAQHRNGQLVWFSTNCLPIYDKNGEFNGYRGVDNNITERKRIQQELEQSEARWRSVLDGTDQGVWDWNAQSNKVYFSPKWKSMLGYEDHEVGDDLTDWSSRVHPDDMPQVMADLNRHFNGESDFYENVHRVQCKDGSYKWILDRGRAIGRDQDGKPLRVIGTHTDVTMRRLEKERLNRIAENVPGVIYQFVLYPDGRMAFPYASPGIADIYDVTPEQVKNDAQVAFKRIHADDLARVSESIAKSARYLTPWEDEYRVILPSGLTRWVNGQATPVKQQDGSILWHGYIHDVTERKQQEQTIHESEQRFRLTLEVTNTGLWNWDVASGAVIWTDECYKQLGLSPQQFTPSFDSITALLVDPQQKDQLLADIASQIQKKQGYAVQFHLKHAAGHGVWIETRGKTVKQDEQGQPLLMMGTHVDISAQKQTELELIASKAQYKDLVDNHPHIINQFKPDTTLIFANQRLAELYGAPLEQVIGQRWIDGLPPEEQQRARENLAAITYQNPVKEYDNQVQTADKGLRTMHWITRGFFDDAQQLTHYQTVGTDVTEQRLAERAINQAKQEAEAANRAKSEFLANMSHEIRTPMNAIMGLSELALQEDLPQKTRSQLNKIQQSSQLLLSIINDILDFSKIESGKMQIAPHPFFFDNLMEQLSSLFSQMAHKKQLELCWKIEPQLAQAYCGDEMRIRQVLINLIGNAIKFTEHGRVELTVSLVKQDEHQAWLLFAVTDSGIGISSQDINKLFRPFTQADSSITRQHGGTGLGLIISQRLVQAMGGSGIEVTSQLGQGSIFSFRLPLAPCSGAQMQTLRTQNAYLQANTQTQRLIGQVLLVEDNEINQEVAGEMLKRMGLSVEVAVHGKQAVEYVKTKHFDLVLMDIQMPVMDGYEAARAIRRFNADIPIIALTAAAMIEDREKAIQSGMNAHLGKPIDRQQLYDTLEQWLAASPVVMEMKTLSASQPSLNGFNVERGLAQLQGNEELYQRLLDQFSQQLTTHFAELPIQLNQLTDESDHQAWSAAQNLAHGLKGVAANLGATDLTELATIIDLELKQHHTVTERTVRALQIAINQAQQGIAQWLSKTPLQNTEIHSSLNVVQAKQQLLDIEQAIIGSEFIERERLQQLAQVLPAHCVAQFWTQFQTSLEQFDFSQAQLQLTQIKDCLEQTLAQAKQRR